MPVLLDPVEWTQLTRVVDDVADYTTDVAMALGVVEVAELGRSLVEARVGRCRQESVLNGGHRRGKLRLGGSVGD